MLGPDIDCEDDTEFSLTENTSSQEKEWTGMMDSFYKGFHPLVDKTIHSKTEHKAVSYTHLSL